MLGEYAKILGHTISENIKHVPDILPRITLKHQHLVIVVSFISKILHSETHFITNTVTG